MKIVVVGGVAAGPRAALTARRMSPDAEIILYERGAHVAYGSCGFPYYIGGSIPEIGRLIHDTPEDFQKRGITAKIRHEVVALLANRKAIKVCPIGGEPFEDSYDRLIIATGARAIIPSWMNGDLVNVFTLRTVEDAQAIWEAVNSGKLAKAVVIGGGHIGMELAEAFHRNDMEVTLLENSPKIMPYLDPSLVQMLKEKMAEHEIHVKEDAQIVGLHGQDGRVKMVETQDASYEADLVLVSIGVTPNSRFFQEAGGVVNAKGCILADDEMKTNLPDVFAAGDCMAITNRLTGKHFCSYLALMAHRTGEVAAINAMGGHARFSGTIGTSLQYVFGLEVGKTGLTARELEAAEMPYRRVESWSRSNSYYCAQGSEILTILYCGHGNRILGVQMAGEEGVASRIRVWATAIEAGLSLEEASQLDLGYTPSLSPLFDPVLKAARDALK